MSERYTLRSRRRPDARRGNGQPGFATRFRIGELDPKPARPRKRPLPCGNLDRASIDRICKVVKERGGADNSTSWRKRVAGARAILRYLACFEGRTWQQRWEASGLDAGETPIHALVGNSSVGLVYGNERDSGYALTNGLRALFATRVIRPSLLAFRQSKFFQYPDLFREVQADPKLDAYFDAVDKAQFGRIYRFHAKFDVCCALTTQGICFEDLSPEALLYYSVECRKHGLVPNSKKDSTRFAALLAWDVLYDMGHFPAGTPPTMRGHIYQGQRSTEELVDRYPVKNQSIRQLLIDYLDRRRGDTDYSTLSNLCGVLVRQFWQNVEEVAPEQPDLNLSEDVYRRWREKAQLRKDGTPRLEFEATLLPIRSMYMDIHSWALEEPERWGPWAAPCPIPPRDLRGFGQRRRRVKQRIDERIRTRQPLLPHLVRHVDDRYCEARDLLHAATQVDLGEKFTHNGVTYQRTNSHADQMHIDDEFTATVRVLNTQDDTVRPISQEEDARFWDWCIVEVLRHSGIRVEELVELTHTSIRQYERPNGEVVALLVIAPSKTEQERVIPMSAELFHVVATIIRRLTKHEQIPLVSRYDVHEKVWTTPMPFLFQRTTGAVRRVMSPSTVTLRLKRACREIAETHPDFANISITAHDFRRLFATDLVNNGLPIHIGAALLGHLDIQTTRGYVTVFEENVVQHYQQWLANRRAERPEAEYRPVTDEEWTEFEAHFDKRKVELGSCGRPYGTPCNHEHACIRCPMLHINPKMIPRLNELEADLQGRRERAVAEGWLGEIEGIELTLRFLRDKRDEALRINRTTQQSDLGVPPMPRHKPRRRQRPQEIKR